MTKPLFAMIMLLLTAAAPAQNKAVKKPASSATPAASKTESFTLPPRATGNANAPIVMEVYSDYTCPHCRELYLRTLRRVIDDYCKTGKVYLIHRDFPLTGPGHQYSRDADRWADAAVTTGKYEEVVEALFTKQEIWAQTGNIEPIIAEVLSPAELQKVKTAMNARKDQIEAAINADVQSGLALHPPVDQTPTTKILHKGTLLVIHPGFIQYAILQKLLDDQLAK